MVVTVQGEGMFSLFTAREEEDLTRIAVDDLQVWLLQRLRGERGAAHVVGLAARVLFVNRPVPLLELVWLALSSVALAYDSQRVLVRLLADSTNPGAQILEVL